MNKEYKYCPICGHLLVENMIEGRKRKYCTGCGFVDYRNPIPSAGAIAIRDDEILLIKRGEEPGKGIWAPPSGFIESSESPEEACLRELKEEAGVSGTIIKLLGVYYHPSRIYGDVLVIMYLVNNLSGDIKAGDDADDVKFYNINEVDDMRFNCFNNAFSEAKKYIEQYRG